MTPEPVRRPAEKLPEWFPPWAAQLADLFFSGTTAAFVLHGNTYDLFRTGGDDPPPYGVLAEFLAQQLFGRWSIVLHYDIGRGLRAFAGSDEKRLKEMVALVDEKIGDVSDRLAGNPHVAAIEVPLPDEKERETFIRASVGAAPSMLADFSDFDAAQLAKVTAGISLTDVNVLIQSARERDKRLDAGVFRSLKKRLLERQCRGLLEFIEPKWTLDTVVGHEAGKSRLREDAALRKRGALDSLPMGYLLCGPVGTGKSFRAQCAGGEIGV